MEWNKSKTFGNPFIFKAFFASFLKEKRRGGKWNVYKKTLHFLATVLHSLFTKVRLKS